MKTRQGHPYQRGVSLQEHLEKVIELRFAAIEQATALAKEDMNRRLEGMNEFREQLRDQATRFIVRSEYDLKHTSLEAEIKALTRAKDMMDGKASQTSLNITLVISVIGLLIGLFGMLRHFRV